MIAGTFLAHTLKLFQDAKRPFSSNSQLSTPLTFLFERMMGLMFKTLLCWFVHLYSYRKSTQHKSVVK